MGRKDSGQTRVTGPAVDYVVDPDEKPQSVITRFFAEVSTMVNRSELPQRGHAQIGGLNFPVNQADGDGYKFPGARM
ncbi:MAG: hypothetical protein HRT94_01955 [Alphaproteobacteria bacterium]|nr:hypothetical protein [Alphaproteobacteria bacterium]